MLTTSDILHLPFTPDLSESGTAYACRSLAYFTGRMGASPLDHLRRIAAGVAVELAFRRYLREQSIPFGVLGVTPFTDPDHYDVSLAGHRCEIQNYLISRRNQIIRLRSDPSLVLQAPALVPLDQFVAEGRQPGDLYIFAFLLGVVAASRADLQRALNVGQPAYLLHPLPAAWARPVNWLPLADLALKSECDLPLTVEIGGLDAGRGFLTRTLELPARTRLSLPGEFYSLSYIHAAHQPSARIGLHCPRRGAPYIIQPLDWGNLWVYGMDILLTGWLNHAEFRRRSKVLNVGMHTLPYDRTRVKSTSPHP